MIRPLFIILLYIFFYLNAGAQELFVFTEPASNIPARAISIRLVDRLVPHDKIYERAANRLTPELYVGISKKLMAAAGGSFSNMHTADFRSESYFAYLKYRFLSVDDVHRHFRMAAFASASHTAAPFHYDEVSLAGDKSGVELGLVATQLWNKLALSATTSHVQLLDASRTDNVVYVPTRIYAVMNYSLSAGLLVLPVSYTSYRQVNLNLYTEFLAQQALDPHRYFIDWAPAVQLILFSNTRLNIGYRRQLWGNALRMTKGSWQFGVERTFLN